MALGERLIAPDLAIDCVDKFLSTEFEGGRHQRRVDKLSLIDANGEIFDRAQLLIFTIVVTM